MDGWWRNTPHSVLLATGDMFDVIEVSEQVGVAAAKDVRTGPVAVSPDGRWMFLVAPRTSLRPELGARLDAVLHGPGSWIPAPPTRTPLGRIRWDVRPAAVGWRIPESRTLQQALVSQLPPAIYAATGRHLRTAA